MSCSSNKNDTNADKIVYFGVININENGRTIGAVDVWRSAITKELFCEEKRLGVVEIADYIGMPKVAVDKKWAIAISRRRSGNNRWKLINIIKEGTFEFINEHDNDENGIIKSEVVVKDYNIVDDEWWSFLVQRNINRSIEVAT